MDIGLKIKNARNQANITQEQAAEALGVSRQTISNWENCKTYPDIISVVKMSDLYHISLDHLLKEEQPMANYLDYLEESTNTVKSHEKLSKIILISVYLGIWGIALAVFWLYHKLAYLDAMGYSWIFTVILLPITSFTISVIIGKNNYWGRLKWFAAIILGIMYMLSYTATFDLANMISHGKLNMPDMADLGMLLIGGIISAVGIAVGVFAGYIKSKTKKNNT